MSIYPHINLPYIQSENSPCELLSPELLQFFSILINRDSSQIAWRKAVIEPTNTAKLTQNAPILKNTFTGSPAFKELKNLIIVILLNNSGKNKPQ